MDDRSVVLWRSLLLTILIFAVGVLINHGFDAVRIETIVGVMRAHEIDTDSFQVERQFARSFGGEECAVLASRIADFKGEIRKVGEDLGSYSRFSFFRKTDYDYLKRKYFLLELRFLSLVLKANEECGRQYVPIVFFYGIDDEASERQGFILEELSKGYEQQVVVLSLDKDYRDEPLVQALVRNFNVTSSPATVVDGQVFEGLVYTGPLNATLQRLLRQADPYAQEFDFMFTPKAAGINVSQLITVLDEIRVNNSQDPFAQGDAALIVGRLTQNDSLLCSSLAFYDRVNSSNPRERALIAETSAALGCGRNRQAFLRLAAKEWDLAGVRWRSEMLAKLAKGERFVPRFDDAAIEANVTVISGYKTPVVPNISGQNASQVMIGLTGFVVNDSARIVSQDDRVLRDWLGGQLQNPYRGNILTTFSERLFYNDSELRSEIGWHEGARIKELLKTNAVHIPVAGTFVARSGDRWFASDDEGVFRFEVPLDKVLYPTTRFLRSDLAVIVDSHGVNMLVDDAIRQNATVVVGCCDHPGKIYAAEYLSKRGIDVICFTDKYLFLALGHNLSAVGSPPLTQSAEGIVVGKRPLAVARGERVVAVNSSAAAYALWYYQAPSSYVEVLDEAFPLNVTYVQMMSFGEMEQVVARARAVDARVIFARVFNGDDYRAMRGWLEEDISHRAFLFHSASYPYGKLILDEFPLQVSFDDPNPVFI